MGKRANSFFGGMALAAAGALGTVFLLRRKKPAELRDESAGARQRERSPGDRWARPGMSVTFRAELMPGRERESRTFSIAELLPSQRVVLRGVSGEHSEHEFETTR